MPYARTWQELLGRHPVLRRARALGLVEAEHRNLIRHLERARILAPAELAALRAPGSRQPAQLMGLNARIAELLDRISHIESGFSAARREEILARVFAFLAEATGFTADSIRELFPEIKWRTPSLAEVVAGGGLRAPARRIRPEDLQIPTRRRLLAWVAKRITHDLLIHGNSLRFFYQALPMMRDTLDRGAPGLTDLYIGFAASLQLMMMLFDGPYPDGAAIRAGRVEVEIREQTFRIRVSAINFPSLFNEVVKGVYESLLHPGLPTSAELADDETTFRELTSGPDLEYELQKLAPEASLRIHRALVRCYDADPRGIHRGLQRAGYGEMPPSGGVSVLYRSFARLPPVPTFLFAVRALAAPPTDRLAARFSRLLIRNMED